MPAPSSLPHPHAGRAPLARGATAIVALLLALIALAGPGAPTASAQQSYVRARSSLVGHATPCINTTQVGSHTLAAACSTQPTYPDWCPAFHPNDRFCNPSRWPLDSMWRNDLGLDTVRASVRVSNTNGQLKAETGLIVETRSRAANTPGFNQGYAVDAYSQRSDQIDFGVPPVGGWAPGRQVEFTFLVHGALGVMGNRIITPASVEHGIRSRLRWTFDKDVTDATSTDVYGQIELKTAGTPATNVQRRDVDSVFVVTDTLGAFQRYLGFQYSLQSDIGVPPGGGYDVMQEVLSARAWGQFGNTAGLLGVRILDAVGTDITVRTPFAFANGTQFVTRASTVPEPGTWALLGTGLLALGGVTRRRSGARG
jgi:hypothetical protein